MAKKIAKKLKKVRMNKVDETSRIEILRIGKTTEFWKIIADVLEQSIDHINDQMEAEELKDLQAHEYKLTNELFKAKKKFLRTLIDTPDNVISWLGTPDTERKDFDPYDKA